MLMAITMATFTTMEFWMPPIGMAVGMFLLGLTVPDPPWDMLPPGTRIEVVRKVLWKERLRVGLVFAMLGFVFGTISWVIIGVL